LNLHALRHYHLKVACLPIPPYAQRPKSKGDCGKSEAKNEAVPTAVPTGSTKTREKAGFNGWGAGGSDSKNGALYGNFKSAGRTRWKNPVPDGVNHARELLTDEIKREVKVDWKRS